MRTGTWPQPELEVDALTALADKYGSDKGTKGYGVRDGHGYAKHYQTYFEPMRNEALNVLEIGIGEYGASMKMWEEYFPNAQIIGLDINPDYQKHANDRSKVYIGSQVDGRVLGDIANECGLLDIIIDDGSHNWAHTIKTFELAFPLVRSGGFYAVEDLATSYDLTWGRRPRLGTSLWDAFSLRSPMSYFKTLLDQMHVGWSGIEFIHFYRELCVIKKK